MLFSFKEMSKVASTVALRAIAGFCLAVSAGSIAHAQDCGCVVPLSSLPSGQAIGQLTSASGPVSILGADGWVSAGNGTPLFLGSQIETGAGALVSLSVGGCSLNVGAQSAASLIPANQSLCVAVSETVPATNPAGNAAGTGTTGAAAANNPVVMGIAGGIGATAGVIAVATEDDDPVSQ